MQQIILASQSINRRKMFNGINIPFEVVVSNFDETSIVESDAAKRTLQLAEAKGKEVAKRFPEAIIISADTYTVSLGKTMEKPKTLEEAKNMLLSLSGKPGICFTGFYYHDAQNNLEVLTTVQTDIVFRELYPSEIDIYIQNYPVLTWAAGYALIDEYTFGFVKQLSGSLTSLSHGLPMELLIPLLKRSGFEPKPKAVV